MAFVLDERPSDSRFVKTLWHAQIERAEEFTSVAVSHWEMVVTKLNGKTSLTIRGPETKATVASAPADGEFFGIVFKHGAFMPRLPTHRLVDDARELPRATSRSFELDGGVWQFPSIENADTFVNRLVKKGVLVFDDLVETALSSAVSSLSTRTLRRHCLRATGLTSGAIRQIDRARQAAALLQQGVPILDTVDELDYFDQAHLTHRLKRLIGHTPAELSRLREQLTLSLSYKNAEFRRGIERGRGARKR